MREVAVWVGVWALASWVTHRYHQYPYHHRLTYDLAPLMKMLALVAGALAILKYLEVLHTPWTVFLQLLLGYAGVDAVLTTMWHFKTKAARRERPGLWEISQPAEQKRLSSVTRYSRPSSARPVNLSVDSPLPEALNALVQKYCLQAIDSSVEHLNLVRVRSTGNESGDQKAIIAITDGRLNDQRRIIRYLLRCYSELSAGGWLIGNYAVHDDPLRSPLRGFTALIQFLTHRTWPKIPLLNRLYFAITNGRNRSVSRTEMWGRLQYAGFELVEDVYADGQYYFVAQKLFEPRTDSRPSYYPVVAFKRVGYHGRIVKLHKIRTMYPFSEFIQKKVFEQQSLDGAGKFLKDPRITGWGQFCRRYWIDELPQVLDWFRSEIKLVGVRPMSQHYFSLYPQEYKESFVRVKPGLVPPLFDDNQGSFDAIVETEGAYLRDYQQRTWRADLSLLALTTLRILRGVRSK